MTLTPCEEHETGCRRCGAPITGRRISWCSDSCRLTYYRDHVWRFARKAALRRDRFKCVRCGAKAEEVDHIIPRNGLPLSTWSCLHHLDNLRSLCHHDHVTRKQWDSVVTEEA